MKVVKLSNSTRRGLAIAVIAAAVVGGFLLQRSFAAALGPVIAKVEAEQMLLPAGTKVYSDSTASNGLAVKDSASGTVTLTSSVSLPGAGDTIAVTAKGAQCQKSWPSMSLSVDGKQVLSVSQVSATSWNNYTSAAGLNLASGSHSLSLSVTNYMVNNNGRRCTTAVYLDVTTFYGITPPPAPTVSLSASPGTISAGSSSTLSWSSTNATGCSASGAWSGSEPTSGSASTGALNATSTYGLTCTGAGGSASASTTVTVTPVATATCGSLASQAPPATYSHVIWIWMENKAYSEIVGSSAAPYENQLANQCGLATNYTAVTHPSLPNYIAATSGSTQGITDDNPPSSHPLSVDSIFSQIASSGSYEESMPANCDQTDAYPYAVKHNPEAYFTTIQTACQTNDVPLSSFSPNSLPAFSFITPNMCDDTHDCPVSNGDTWLQNFLPGILGSADYQAGKTAVFLTWDEDDNSGNNQVAMIVLSANTPAATLSGTAFNHYSLLRTTEEMLGTSGYLGNASTANSMRSDFHL
jgi:hypothetical protein